MGILLRYGVFIFAIVVVAAVVIGALLLMKSLHDSRERSHILQHAQQNAKGRWKKLEARYQQILERVTAYETELSLAIRYPAMNDPTEPATAAMLEALHDTELLLSSIRERALQGDDDVLATATSKIAHFAAKVEQAEHHAKKVALQNLSEQDRKDFQQAQQLLKHIYAEGNPDAVRAGYVERLRTLVQRVNQRHNVDVIPTHEVSTLTHQYRHALNVSKRFHER